MSTECKNLEVYKNTSKTYALYFKRDGGAIDITGWTIYFTVKNKQTDTDANAIIKKDITTHANEQGKTQIELTTTDLNITVGSYWYDIKYLDDDGNADIIIRGHFEIKNPVTQR